MYYEITYTLIISILVILVIIIITIVCVFYANKSKRDVIGQKKNINEKEIQKNINENDIQKNINENDIQKNINENDIQKNLEIGKNLEKKKNTNEIEKTNDYIKMFGIFNELYISKSINDPPTKFIQNDMIDAFFYNNNIYIISLNNTKICCYNLKAELVSEYISNLKITSNVEIVGDNLYTINEGILFKAKLGIPNSKIINFENQNELVQNIISNCYNTKLYKRKLYNDPYVLLGNEDDYVTLTHKYVFYKSAKGSIEKVEHNSNHVFYYEKKLYLNPHRVKVFHANSIFLHMK